MNITQKTRNAVNNLLAPIGRKYYPQIPLDTIFSACTTNGLTPVQEDETPWSGLLCGRNGYTTINLASGGQPVQNAVLVLGWYKMPVSGNYEVNCYLS